LPSDLTSAVFMHLSSPNAVMQAEIKATAAVPLMPPHPRTP